MRVCGELGGPRSETSAVSSESGWRLPVCLPPPELERRVIGPAAVPGPQYMLPYAHCLDITQISPLSTFLADVRLVEASGFFPRCARCTEASISYFAQIVTAVCWLPHCMVIDARLPQAKVAQRMHLRALGSRKSREQPGQSVARTAAVKRRQSR